MLYQHRSDVFQDVAAYDYTSPGFNITGDRPEQIKGDPLIALRAE